MKKIDKILWFAGLALLSSGAYAQVAGKDSLLDRTVVVEHEYAPEIMDASKINVLPAVKESAVPKREIEYSQVSVPLSSWGAFHPMQPLVASEEEPAARRGYVRAGYGNYGNLDGRFGYLFDFSKKDRLGIAAGINGMNGKLKFGDGERHRQHYYRSFASLAYAHRFSHSVMDISGKWGQDNFSYAPSSAFARQKFMSGDVHWGLKSLDASPLQFAVEANWLHYLRAHNMDGTGDKRVHEDRACTKARVDGEIDASQKMGLFAQMDNIFYSGHYLTDYTSLQLNPYYELRSGGWRLHAGIHVDFSFGHGDLFQVSPDVDVQYQISSHYILYAKATGGRILSDFRRLGDVNPYMALQGNPIFDTYEQTNASLGFRMNPHDGVYLHLYGGYQHLNDDLYHVEGTGFMALAQEDDHNTYAGAAFSYACKKLLKVSLEGTYRHWTMDDAEGLAFKPSCLLHVAVEARPLPSLLLHAGYEYAKAQKDFGQGIVHDLGVKAAYDLYKGLAVYADFGNVLNRRYNLYWGYPAEGFHFLAGLSYSF